MRLSRALKDKLFDVRLRDKFLDDNKISKEQVTKYEESLLDDSDKFVFLKDEKKTTTAPEPVEEPSSTPTPEY